MPIWEYSCRKCDSQFERIQWRQSEKVECPDCGSTRLEKMVPTFSVARGGFSGAQEAGPCPCGAPRRGMCGD